MPPFLLISLFFFPSSAVDVWGMLTVCPKKSKLWEQEFYKNCIKYYFYDVKNIIYVLTFGNIDDEDGIIYALKSSPYFSFILFSASFTVAACS